MLGSWPWTYGLHFLFVMHLLCVRLCARRWDLKMSETGRPGRPRIHSIARKMHNRHRNKKPSKQTTRSHQLEQRATETDPGRVKSGPPSLGREEIHEQEPRMKSQFCEGLGKRILGRGNSMRKVQRHGSKTSSFPEPFLIPPPSPHTDTRVPAFCHSALAVF